MNHLKNTSPTLSDIKSAAQRIAIYIQQTPVLTSKSLNKQTGAELHFKCENFQKMGAFKFRGACNAVFSLSEEESKNGVATHSSGNHGAALALAAKLRKIESYIVVPENSTPVKLEAVEKYGGKITFCKPTLESRESTLEKVAKKTGAVFIHPYNDHRIIAGQGTAALELLEEFPELDIIVTPIGGGGLISGSAIAAKTINPNIKIIGAEPEGADDAYQSFKTKKFIPCNNPNTIADGLRASLGSLTFPIILKYVSDILTVSENEIISAMKTIRGEMKITIEPSSAVAVAVVIYNTKKFQGKKVGIILSGGNVDFDSVFNQ